MQRIKHIYSISLLISIGILTIGCGKIPPVPEKEKLQQMSFEEFMEHQRYYTSNKLKPDYLTQSSVNTKLSNAKEDVYGFMSRRIDGLTQYCNAIGGTIQNKEVFRDSLIAKSNQYKLEWLAAEKQLALKIPGWNNISSYCVINDKPFFGFQIKQPYIENTRIDNAWWTTQVKVRKITSLENLSDTTPFLSQQELADIKSNALAMDEQNQQRQKRYDEAEKRKKEQKEQKEQKERELNVLRNRKGTNTMTFFDNYKCYDNTIADGRAIDARIAVYNSFTKALSFTPAMCQQICQEENEKYTGYTQLQQALDDKWQFISKLGDKQYQQSNCVCTGFQFVLKK
ncbi:hypothetical protein [Sulfuricurvum sp.]|uniref:hypothetical protein n=1 Tax=Sulfuricurvum sp. TaxID=2025608 RepID=UPI00261219C7|nr:hypothetical protein [Sulfuricurvum sp.]MDD3597777.1 hypothetical protein [Sulfuricurvum sp.]